MTAYGLGTAALAVLGWWLGDATWWLASTNTMAFWLLLPALVLAPLAALRRRALPAAACALAALCWLALFGPLYLPQLPPGEADLRVVSYNVFTSTQPRIDHIVDLVERVEPDVLLLQEVRIRPQAQLEGALPDHPYQWYAPRPADDPYDAIVGVVSRYPITDVELVGGLPDGARATGVVTLDVNGRAVRVVSAHFTSPCLDCPLLEQPAQLAQDAARRRAEATAVAGALGGEGVIVGGDLNSSMLNDPRRVLLGSGLRDVHRDAGWGAGTTRDLKGIGVRIDWLLASPDLAAVRSWTEDSDISDHRPVVADLRLDGAGDSGG